MKKDDSFEPPNLSPEAITALREARERIASGTEGDVQVVEALKAIDIAGRVVSTIMSGNQIDPVFFKHLSDLTQERILGTPEDSKPKKIKKKRKFRRRSK